MKEKVIRAFSTWDEKAPRITVFHYPCGDKLEVYEKGNEYYYRLVENHRCGKPVSVPLKFLSRKQCFPTLEAMILFAIEQE